MTEKNHLEKKVRHLVIKDLTPENKILNLKKAKRDQVLKNQMKFANQKKMIMKLMKRALGHPAMITKKAAAKKKKIVIHVSKHSRMTTKNQDK